MLISKFLGVPLSSQIRGAIRPVLVTTLFFAAAVALDGFFSSWTWSGVSGWLLFLLSAGATGILMLLLSFYAGLTGEQRSMVVRRVQAAVKLGDAS